MNVREQEKWQSISKLINDTQVKASEVFLLGLELLNALGIKKSSEINIARKAIIYGVDKITEMTKSVSVEFCIKDLLEKKKATLRKTSLTTIKSHLSRIIRTNPKLKARKIRDINTEDCKQILTNAFTTPRQFINGRSALSNLFAHAKKRNWVDKNPVLDIDTPKIEETPIYALSVNDCKLLLNICTKRFDGDCLLPAAILLFSGIRPTELTRLTWAALNIEENIITVSAAHSKTGGARHVTIYQPLKNIINLNPLTTATADKPIVPKNWNRKWRAIRHEFCKKSGCIWFADILRHSFASYHAKHFRNYHDLQLEMGHRDSSLLRTRYINLAGINFKEASLFWEIHPRSYKDSL